jgi:hypothetical protein
MPDTMYMQPHLAASRSEVVIADRPDHGWSFGPKSVVSIAFCILSFCFHNARLLQFWRIWPAVLFYIAFSACKNIPHSPKNQSFMCETQLSYRYLLKPLSASLFHPSCSQSLVRTLRLVTIRSMVYRRVSLSPCIHINSGCHRRGCYRRYRLSIDRMVTSQAYFTHRSLTTPHSQVFSSVSSSPTAP